VFALWATMAAIRGATNHRPQRPPALPLRYLHRDVTEEQAAGVIAL